MPISIVIRSEEGKIVAKHEPQYPLYAILYLKTDPEQYKRMVTNYIVDLDRFSYELTCGTEVTNHAEIEITPLPGIIE